MKRVVVALALVVMSIGAFPVAASAAGPGMTRGDGVLYTGCIANDDPVLAGLLKAGFTPENGNPVVRCATGTTGLGKLLGN
ncbi:MAG: hypothetical protein EPO65_11030 [Dehalococcoidia bacterium]|nr:MAG: hypothetical protein EPO65_11030 [Dehalococcoidia bacterium]